MPAKKQITRDAIMKAALRILRRDGPKAVNARSIARALKCSTQPIYLSFRGMDELKDALLHEADDVYHRFIQAELAKAAYMPYKAQGMAYIRFAKAEKELFKLLFMRERNKGQIADEKKHMHESVLLVSAGTGLSYEAAYRFHLEMWVFGHGIATMLATDYFDLDWETIGAMLGDAYLGLLQRYQKQKEERENEPTGG